MDILFELLGWLLFRPIFWFFQGLFGILRTTDKLELGNLRRFDSGLLIVSAIGMGLFLVGLFLWRDWRLLLGGLGVWLTCTLFANWLGAALEQ